MALSRGLSLFLLTFVVAMFPRVNSFLYSRVRYAQVRNVRIPTCRQASVTGSVYTGEDDNSPVVRLFTKEGCTLCDKVKDVLYSLKEELPHTLEQVDITDDEHQEWFSKYKYDIPVLHINGQYWIKHRLDAEGAREGLSQGREGQFVARKGEPNAAAMERDR